MTFRSVLARAAGHALLGALLALGWVLMPLPARAEPGAPLQIVGCGGSSPVADETENDNEADSDQPDANDPTDKPDAVEPGDPIIVGTIRALPRMSENDQKGLARLARISGNQATQSAQAVIPDIDLRKVSKVELDIEQGFVVWKVTTALKDRAAHPDAKKEVKVKVDAGNGDALAMECE